MQPRNHSRRQFLRYSAMVPAAVALMGGARGVEARETGQVTAPAVSSLPPAGERQGDYVEVNGARIFYEVAGQGEPMLLIHGYPLSGALFARNRDALAEHFQVITIDLRGYGNSTTPGIPDSIEVYAKDALAVLDELGVQQAIIGGHSMGGQITLEMYQRAPERFRGMILIDTNAAAASNIEAGLWSGIIQEVKQNGISTTYIDFLNSQFLTGHTRLKQPELVNYVTQTIQQASVDAAIGGARALATRADYTRLLGRIRVPTLVFVGLEDPVYPVEISQMINRAIPNSRIAIIPGASHAAILEAPELSNAAILDWAAGIGGAGLSSAGAATQQYSADGAATQQYSAGGGAAARQYLPATSGAPGL